jgi:quinol monooxygenase YgiN
MSISLGAAAVGALVSLVFTGMLVRRCIRLPRMANVALFFATAGLTVSLAAQAIGYDRGFGQTTFRAVQLGAQLVGPLALTWALSEFTSKSLGARFAARLGLGALMVIGGVVLTTDPLASAGFSKSWPAASVHYQLIPNWVLEVIAVVTAFFAVVAVIVAGVRGRQSAGWRTLFLAVAAVAAGSVALDWLRASLPASTAYPAACLAAAALAWFAGMRSSSVRLESLRSGGYSWDEDTGSFVRYHEDTGDFGYGDDTGGFGRAGGATDGRGWYADDTGGFRGGTDGGFRRDPADTDFSGWFRPGDDTGSFRRVADPAAPGVSGPGMSGPGMSGPGMSGPDPGGPATGAIMRDVPGTGYAQYGVVPPETDRSSRAQNGTAAHNQVAYVETGDVMAIVDAEGFPALPQMPAEDTSRLYGQIAIYTLLDESADDFERLASEVVEQVKTREPDTLVYVMHGVPAAPMQRILYAVYRDEAAYDEHERQPYIRQFEEEREPFVLATNVIELGVKQGKFAPQPGSKRRPLVRKSRPRSSGGR